MSREVLRPSHSSDRSISYGTILIIHKKRANLHYQPLLESSGRDAIPIIQTDFARRKTYLSVSALDYRH